MEKNSTLYIVETLYINTMETKEDVQEKQTEKTSERRKEVVDGKTKMVVWTIAVTPHFNRMVMIHVENSDYLTRSDFIRGIIRERLLKNNTEGL